MILEGDAVGRYDGRRSQGAGVRTIDHDSKPSPKLPSATSSPSTVDNEAGILAKHRRPVHRARLQHRQPDRGRHHRRPRCQPHHHRRRTARRRSSIRSGAQLERLVPVHKVVDLTEVGPHVERELALIKVAGKGDDRRRGAAPGRRFRAPRSVDTTDAAVSCSN